MAEVLGAHTILERALPTGVDGTKLAEWRLRDGMTYQQFANATAQALGDFNAGLERQWGWVFGVTEEDHMEYEDGQTATAMPEIGDTGRPDLVRGLTKGHMIELVPYGRGIGGSRRYFRDARAAQMAATVQTITRQARWRFEQKVVSRMFTNTENAIGSSGYDVPWARGSSATIKFTPPSNGSENFTQSHNHFIGVDSGSKGFDDLLEELAEHVEEHGHNPSFTALVSRADVASYNALDNFVQITAPIIQNVDRGGETSGNRFFVSGSPMVTDGVFGYYQSDYGLIELRSTPRVPTGYASLVKSEGVNSPMNPIAVRVHPNDGFGAYIVPETIDDRQYPIKALYVEFEFGISVGMDRTKGATGYLVAGGTWANPTIS